jgi:hypothetical protein
MPVSDGDCAVLRRWNIHGDNDPSAQSLPFNTARFALNIRQIAESPQQSNMFLKITVSRSDK